MQSKKNKHQSKKEIKQQNEFQQNEFQQNITKIILGGIAIFTFGIFIGYQLNHGTISSIQGYLFSAMAEASDSNASSSNASNSNASNSNASNSNASNSNASSSNASDANASKNNIIYLNSLSLNSNNANAGDKININKSTSGACNSGMSIVFINNSTNDTFTANVKSISDNPYIEVPSNAIAGTYVIKSVYLVGDNSDKTTFSKTYTSADFNFNVSLTINAKKVEEPNNANNNTPVVEAPLTLNSISLNEKSVNIGDKVHFTYSTSTKITNIKFTFKSANGNEIVVYGKSLNNNSYFEIPSTAKSDTYSLSTLTISSSSKSTIYSNDGSINGSTKFDFNASIEVKDGKEKEAKFVYNNEDINTSIITALYNADSKTEITINADSDPIISKELFNAIKGTNKKLIINYKDNQVVFNGRDISSTKDIDISISTSLVNNDENINKLVDNGIIVNFASNGNLPGNATVKIKITDEMTSKLGSNPIYVYYYNESCKDFTTIAEKVKANDGYYEIKLSHNSQYLLSDVKLKDSLIAKNDGNIVNFQKSNKMNLLLIGLGIVLIGVVIAVLVINKKNKSTKDKK